jgi:uncharacterized protein YkvS
MPSKFTCEICSKVFKTTQHLNQHKNRKKKCQPCSKSEPLMNMNLLTTIIETSSSTSSSSGASHSGICSTSNISDITSSLLTLNANTNANNSDIVYKANQTLIDLIIKYKLALDEIKKLEIMYNGTKNHVQKLQNEIISLKKQLYIVHKFVDEFTGLVEKENEASYISALTETDNNTINLHFPDEDH